MTDKSNDHQTFLPAHCRVYLVGGAVRDQLLGRAVSERDWLVVGGSREEMLAAGYRQADPDFPVFLHPLSGDEYALARREQKTAGGYRGFVIDASPQVTLEQDLARRDFTVNAMALDMRGNLVDLFNGQKIFADGRLRHITAAFVEDPLRILRAARFAAKLDFRLAHATHKLMKQMVQQGAVDELLPQRTGKELNRALHSDQPWRFFQVLQACGALGQLAPGTAQRLVQGGQHAAGVDGGAMAALRHACAVDEDPAVRLAAFLLQSTDSLQSLEKTLAPGRESLHLLAASRDTWQSIGSGQSVSAQQLLGLLNKLRAWHRDGLFDRVVAVLRAQSGAGEQVDRLLAAREAAMQVSSDQLQADGLQGAALGKAIRAKRVAAIAAVW